MGRWEAGGRSMIAAEDLPIWKRSKWVALYETVIVLPLFFMVLWIMFVDWKYRRKGQGEVL